MTAPDLELQPAVEAAGQALYESFAAHWIRQGSNPADVRAYDDLPPLEKFHWRKLALPVVVAVQAPIARQAWEIGATDEFGMVPDANPWATPDDWDEALKRL